MKTFHLPDLGEGLAEAEIREWYIKIGDEVRLDQPLVSMETAKAVVDVPSPYTGKIIELFGKVNDIIQTGSPLVSFELQDHQEKSKGSVVGSLEESTQKWEEKGSAVSVATRAPNIKAMPAARSLAKQLNIDISLISPSGPQNLITPQDVKMFAESQLSHAVLQGNEGTLLHGVRRAMALTMTQSHQEIVPVTITEDVDISHLSGKIDITIHLLHAMVYAAKAEPAVNAWFNGKTLERQLLKEINIGIAIDTEEGLFVPVIKHIESLSMEDLRQTINHYKSAAKSRSISPKEMQHATITLSNFGNIAGRYATPIIVSPTVAILACGRMRNAVLPKDGSIKIGRVLPLSLTVDHRAVTGGEAARFLQGVMQYFESCKRETS